MSYELRHVIKRNARNRVNDSLLKKILDKMAYPVAIIGPLSSLDQVLTIWNEKSAAGVSVIVWIVILCTSTFWAFYATVHRERVIFFGHIIWIILTSIILFEIFIFS
jgi:uncharacterized protein with PQ loop repeat